MIEQRSFFPVRTITIYHEVSAGRRRGVSVHSVTVYDEDGFPIIFVEGEHKGARNVKRDMMRAAYEALLQNRVRPFGDEYLTPVGAVSYLTDL